MISYPDCSFCTIARGEDPLVREIYRDAQIAAFFPRKPAALGHTLVVPVKHVRDIWELDDATMTEIAHATVRVAHSIRAAIAPEGLNVIQSNGVAATQTIMHLHVHVLPRWSSDTIGRIWPDKTSFSVEEVESAFSSIKAAIDEDVH